MASAYSASCCCCYCISLSKLAWSSYCYFIRSCIIFSACFYCWSTYCCVCPAAAALTSYRFLPAGAIRGGRFLRSGEFSNVIIGYWALNLSLWLPFGVVWPLTGGNKLLPTFFYCVGFLWSSTWFSLCCEPVREIGLWWFLIRTSDGAPLLPAEAVDPLALLPGLKVYWVA